MGGIDVFSIGDNVVYGCVGVCNICEIITKRVMKQNIKYFVLKPVHDEQSTLFVPVDNELLCSKMRPLLTKAEINDVINDLKNHNDIWIDEENRRKEEYNNLLSSGDRLKILLIIRSILNHKDNLALKGKQLHLNDKKLIKTAQKIIDSEFSTVLGIKTDEVQNYIFKSQNS